MVGELGGVAIAQGSEWSEWVCGQESRTRAPSRLSRMRTTLLARLGEISIVLHAGDARVDAKRMRGNDRTTASDNATVMEKQMDGWTRWARNSAVRSGSYAVQRRLRPRDATKRDCCEGFLVAGAHLQSCSSLVCITTLNTCRYLFNMYAFISGMCLLDMPS